jgi:hypothetical protein
MILFVLISGQYLDQLGSLSHVPSKFLSINLPGHRSLLSDPATELVPFS